MIYEIMLLFLKMYVLKNLIQTYFNRKTIVYNLINKLLIQN